MSEDHIQEVARPWLEPLGEKIYIQDISQPEAEWSESSNYKAVYGVVDSPSKQEQYPLAHDMEDRGHIALFSGPGMGKTTFLETIVMDLVRNNSPEQAQFYLMDYGASGLLRLLNLPHAADLVYTDDIAKTRKLIERIQTEIKDRKTLFTREMVSSLSAYEFATKQKLPRLFFIIDSYEGIKGTPLVAGIALKTVTVVGTTYAVAEGVSAATTGSSLISGTQMSDSQRNFAVATAGVSSKLSGAKGALSGMSETAEGFQVASNRVNTLNALSRGLDYADDALAVSEIGYNTMVKGEDPTMSIAGLAAGKVVSKLAAFGQARQNNVSGVDTDIPSKRTTADGLNGTNGTDVDAFLTRKTTDVDLTTKSTVTAETAGAVVGAKVQDVEVPKAKSPVKTRTKADDAR